MAGNVPDKYNDPFWQDLASETEAKLNLPDGVLVALINHGERSNHSAVSPVGARTVMQIMPQTRKAAIDKYGIDPYLSPENAVEVGGLLLKDSLQRNKGDVALALAEYHGGTDRGNWGSKTKAYVSRVMAALPSVGRESTFERVSREMQPNASSQIAAVYDAYKSGKMTPEEKADFEADVKDGKLMLPKGATIDVQTTPLKGQAVELPREVANAYELGKMTPQEKAELEADLAAGVVKLPPSLVSQIPGGATQPAVKQPEPGLIDKAVGALETGATLATGATTGALGYGAGALSGIVTSVQNGTFGTPEGVKLAADAADAGAQQYTYTPRGQSGQEQAEAVGGAMQNLIPIAGIGHEVGMAASALKQAAKPAVVQAVESASTVGKQALSKLPGMRSAASEGVMPTEGSFQSAGAAGADPVAIARATASRGSPELQAEVERAIKKKEGIHQKALENHVEAETLDIPVRLTQGQALEDPILISQEKNTRGKHPEYIERTDANNKALIENLNVIRERQAPDVFLQDKLEHGDALIDSYKKLKNQLDEDTRAKYKALEDANGGDFPIDANSFVRNAEEALAKKNRAHWLPPEIASLLELYKKTGTMTFNQFEELRTILATEQRSQTGNKKFAVNLVRQALEDMPMTQETAALKPLADAARNAAKLVHDMQRADPAFKHVAEGKATGDNFITRFVVNAPTDKVQTMLQHLGASDDARQIIASALTQHLKEAARVTGDTGVFAQSGYNKALGKLAPKVAIVFGEDANKLHSVGNVARLLKQQPDGSFVNNSNTAVQLAAKTLADKIPGVSTAKAIADKVKEAKQVERSLRPGAGISAKESALLEVKRKVEAKKAAKKK